MPDAPGLGTLLQLVSLPLSWGRGLLFTWMIARLPRESVSFRSSVRRG